MWLLKFGNSPEQTPKVPLLFIFSQFNESSSLFLSLSVKDKEFPFTVAVGNSLCCQLERNCWAICNIPPLHLQNKAHCHWQQIHVKQEDTSKSETGQLPELTSVNFRSTVLTCLWERSLNTAPEPLPLDLLCHCLFLPWKTLKKPMLESLLQKAIRWQLISALKVSENTLEIKLLPIKTEFHMWHQCPDLKLPQLKISKSSKQQSWKENSGHTLRHKFSWTKI